MSIFDQRILDAVGHELSPGDPVRRRGERSLLGRCLFVWPMHWFGDGHLPEIEVQADRAITTHRPVRQTADGHFKFDLVLAPTQQSEVLEGQG